MLKENTKMSVKATCIDHLMPTHLFIGFKPKFSLQSASGHVRRVDSFRGQDFRYCCSVCAKSAALAAISHEIRTGKSYVLFSILSQGSSNITLSPKCDHTKEELHTHTFCFRVSIYLYGYKYSVFDKT